MAAEDAAPLTVFLRHGGELNEHDWPLHPDIAEQLTKGMVTQASEPGPATWHRPAGDGPSESEQTGREIFATDKPMLPHRSAPKPEWVGYAVKVHQVRPDDAEAMTKQDLIDRFGGAS
ncbi:hypothetical protein [Frankia sp. AgB32]|uniref:hypothetical protein n=1 Tax=Frankia sp. AgB32 TaxID=631119 RepID=UPI0020107E5C|nr:hypothetical protein [Frankia sp. AgB32]MCK9896964.1 hypothetical protein [Frankia sp. AgB32]